MSADRKVSSAEKRALWEVRQRYNIHPPASTHGGGHRHVPPTPPSRQRRATPPPPPRRKRSAPRGKWFKRITLFIILVVLLSGGIFGYKIIAASNKISAAERSVLGQLKDLFFNEGKTLSGEGDDRINIMLIAIGGEGHKGENLADSIMVASIKPATNQVALLSIPRDLYVQVPGESYYSKINAVHAYGEAKKNGHGPESLRTVVEDITGLPIHYYTRVDFTAFKQIVDAVGGVDITMENSFFDYWHKIAFPAGTERMDGERALAYVRARYVEGPEGGDFKRAARQQQVLLALREKVFSVNTALDFTAINSILNSLSNNIRTDLELWEMKRFYEIARQIQTEKVHSVVLTTGPRGVLVGTTEVLGDTPASVLKTRTGDYSEVRDISASIFTQNTPSPLAGSTAPTPLATPSPETDAEPKSKVTVEVRNGTNTTGLAAQTRDQLQAEGYDVIAIGNAQNRSTPTTTVYALSSAHTDTAAAIADTLSAASDSGLPSEEAATEADVLVILGDNAS